VLGAINALGPSNAIEAPNEGNPTLERAARAWMNDTGAELGPATVFRLLAELEDPCEEIALLVREAQAKEPRFADTAKGRWLAQLARALFGEKAARVRVG
jgi:hypothetical protein